jgi:hypothetical protein
MATVTTLVVCNDGMASGRGGLRETGVACSVLAKTVYDLDNALAITVRPPDLRMDIVAIGCAENLLTVMYHCGHILT